MHYKKYKSNLHPIANHAFHKIIDITHFFLRAVDYCQYFCSESTLHVFFIRTPKSDEAFACS